MRENVRRVRRLAHGRDRNRRPRRAGAAAAAALERRREDPDRRARSTRVLCREDGGVLDDLFTYRLGGRPLPDGHERRQPRARPRLVSASTRQDFGEVEVTDRIDDYAMLAVQGPRARELVQAISDAPLPARMTAATRRLAGARGTGMRNRLHRRGRRRAARLAPRCPRLVGRASAARRRPGGAGGARHAAPGGLLPPLRQRPVDRARADRSGARLVLQGGHRLHRRARRCARVREARPARRSSSRSRSRGRGSRARATRRRRRRGHERHALAEPRRRHRHGLRARRAAPRSARAWRSTFVARSARLS